MLSKGYPKAIQRLSKAIQGYPRLSKAIQRLSKGYPKAIQRLSKAIQRLSKAYPKAIQRLSLKIRFWQPHISFTVFLCKVASQATLERIRNKTIKIENVRNTVRLATFLIFNFFRNFAPKWLGEPLYKGKPQGKFDVPQVGFFKPTRLFQPWLGAIPSFSYPIV